MPTPPLAGPRPGSLRLALAIALAAALLLGFLPGLGAISAQAADPFAPQLVTVDTPTRADKDLLTTLGLDLTEHAGRDYIEVVLHRAEEVEVLRAAGLTYDVRIPDLVAREAEINTANAEFAAATIESDLPSGRDGYRDLDAYNADLEALTQIRPDIAKPVELSRTSLEGKTIRGVEIGGDVNAPDSGKPVFLLMGVHHAREWPSGEHAMEFAYDLVRSYGRDARITDLLDRSRVLVVPVVNVDGFEKSVNDGMLVDLREADGGGTASILGTPGNAYKRKNCRMIDGQEPVANECAAATGPGGFGLGVDLNRNYGGFWGGPGASETFADPTYRGPDPFSEPETQAVRELVSSRQITTLISNHTFSNLVLRPNGVHPDTIGPDGLPIGNAPDEDALKALGARMTAQNGYQNIHGWELYDTTGTTEDWSYNATGGFGYTFEIGANEFHPPYPEVIDEYLGAGEFAGKGNREAFLIALENTVDTATHSVLRGKAPAGATLRLARTSATPTWEGAIEDTIETTMQVGADGRFTWHVNPSTRPVVEARAIRVKASEPVASQSYSGATLPTQRTDERFEVTSAADLLDVTLDWPTPDDLDLFVLREEADGSLTEVGSSASFVGEKEHVTIDAPQPGTYVLRVENFASVSPTWTMEAALYDATEQSVGGLIEAWTLTCEIDGQVRQRVPVIVDRGQQAKVDLKQC